MSFANLGGSVLVPSDTLVDHWTYDGDGALFDGPIAELIKKENPHTVVVKTDLMPVPSVATAAAAAALAASQIALHLQHRPRSILRW